ncbi:MAG: hypothetical protein A3C80_03715 [Candidatus Ryanbacteria bacterium RIFCSPHIGHO2_02_FULL_45_43]|uniref:Uncharacterized protein n=1 Tax=Candidatus Ryanbacteria bacterium RIFCSPHIGHO2_01_45_13 TaxID=1802112 RepID=A0A1G2FZZ3_9BACT|nr:MAG: hypothetical protein A2718_02975 [Candidatus Ryanbacteria bacterium RIFCSPHIGHO2_01_FULL_44_130]OGZ43141.1 MAG: hypothetical protein A2W41_00400 [Candidatus Ryanbacteria bacterium RIFCSPHIGHO2_01_45_13]OGZ47784.1 MAG: hypothetical protein A3C80_03715 [Candidatus Ryanbacteria bacterium RIFCSPHIGHO2_02_FULL_45_43]OGZ49677.1 MAG: hypothetical protein A3E55_02170 [Candidatus Ryanbacteria bacterium RIFCSPHIGHO2_12_FULL_44_20]OGZ52170.1 MAG: hypothetical protein A3A17_03035 [Candidatus Ryanba
MGRPKRKSVKVRKKNPSTKKRFLPGELDPKHPYRYEDPSWVGLSKEDYKKLMRGELVEV